jgi:predicted membrane protein
MYLGGFLLFLAIMSMAFWLLIFLTAIALPYAITVWAMHKINPSAAESDAEAVDVDSSH